MSMKLETILGKFEDMQAQRDFYRRALLKIGLVTQCRQTYDIVADTFEVESSDELKKLAEKAKVRA